MDRDPGVQFRAREAQGDDAQDRSDDDEGEKEAGREQEERAFEPPRRGAHRPLRSPRSARVR